jgi:hypothetical protein
MADESVSAVMSAFKKELASVKRAKRSDEIINFISDNWRLFTATKAQMREAKSQLGTSTEYTVDAFCDLLGIPDTVLFKRSPVADVAGALLDFPKSKLMQLFIDSCVQRRTAICLILVAGQKSVCITNMQTEYPVGSMVMYYKATDNSTADIQIFSIDDAAKRLPRLFGAKSF